MIAMARAARAIQLQRRVCTGDSVAAWLCAVGHLPRMSCPWQSVAKRGKAWHRYAARHCEAARWHGARYAVVACMPQLAAEPDRSRSHPSGARPCSIRVGRVLDVLSVHGSATWVGEVGRRGGSAAWSGDAAGQSIGTAMRWCRGSVQARLRSALRG